MQTTEITTADGLRLAHYLWPLEVHKAEVLLVHGLGEHLGRYHHVAAALNQAGYQVSGVDFRGHGKSPGKRGHIKKWSDFVTDLAAAAMAIDGPYLLVGHSMGTLICLDFLRQTPEAKNALAVALSAPLLGAAVEAPKWKTMAADLLAVLLPGLSMSNELDAKEICSDDEVVQRYLEDPLTFHTITPRWFKEMNHALQRVNGVAEQYRLPLWMSYGSEDRIVSLPAADAFCARYGGSSCFKSWPGGRHEIFNETFQRQVLDHLIAWLDQQVS